MLERHLTMPHRFVLLTDVVSQDFDPLIEVIPLWNDWRDLERKAWGRSKPFCYVRLKAFSEEMRAVLGPRFVSIDLDCVVLQNLDPVLERDEDFLIIRRPPPSGYVKNLGPYQASMWMMNAGVRAKVFSEFKGHESIVAARQYVGSDQAWMNHILPPDEKGWTEADGVYNFLNLYKTGHFKAAPPRGARIVFFNGTLKPWQFCDDARRGRTDYRWVAENYRSETNAQLELESGTKPQPNSLNLPSMVDTSESESGRTAKRPGTEYGKYLDWMDKERFV
jgi:hypothetical protein